MISWLAVVTLIGFVALAILFTVVFKSEEAPDWVEMNEYYRSRWYK